MFSSRKEKPMDELLHAMMAAASKVNELHNGDADLVRPGAKHHGVRVIEGDLFTPTDKGNYNPRIPNGSKEEAQRLAQVSTLLGVCEDYRQSDEVVHSPELDLDLQNTAIFSTAGGDAQPDQQRFEADVNFYVSFLDLKPDARVILVHHTNICGGANYYTSGEMKQIRETEGKDGEVKKMNEFGGKMFDAIRMRKPNANVSLWLSEVGEDNHFERLTQVA